MAQLTATAFQTFDPNNVGSIPAGHLDAANIANLAGFGNAASGTTPTHSSKSLTPMGSSGTVAPTVVITSAGGLTNQPVQTITGTVDVADAGTTVTVFDGAAALGTATVQADGTWSTSVTLTGDGTHMLVASDTDASGNTGTSSAISYTLDTTAPATPGRPTESAAKHYYVNAANNTAGQTLYGTAEAGSTVTIYDNGTAIGTVAADATTGAWSATLGVLSEGAHSYTVTATDAAGNTSAASAAFYFTVDTIAPLAPTLTDANVIGGTVNAAHDTTAQTVSGTAEAGATVSVYDGAVLLGKVKADATTGAWSYKIGKLANGAHSLTAKATDAAGNVSAASAALAFTVDITAPVAPTALADTAIINGYVNAAHDAAAQALTGTAEAGAVISLYDGTTLIGTTSANAAGAWNYTLGVLANGAHSVTATATDAASNTGKASAALKFTVDTVAPVAPTALADNAIVGGYVNAARDKASQTLTGTAEARSTVTIYDGTLLLGTVTANAAGSWAYTLGVLADGAHSLTAKATDAAGNVSAASAALAFTVDTVAPAVPVVSDIAYDATHNLATITGQTEANALVTVFDNGVVIGTTTANASGAWSFAAGTTGATTTHKYTETSTDAAGNTSKSAGSAIFSTTSGAKLTGGTGNDVLIGAPGDTLTGGAGNDTFVFHAGFGKETVADFTAPTATLAGDVLQFDTSVFADWAHLLGATKQVGSDLTITLDANDIVTLKNVSLASFTQASARFSGAGLSN